MVEDSDFLRTFKYTPYQVKTMDLVAKNSSNDV